MTITIKAFVEGVVESALRQTGDRGRGDQVVVYAHELRAIVRDNLHGLLGDVDRERHWMGQYGQHVRDSIKAGHEPKPYPLFVETAAAGHHSTPG